METHDITAAETVPASRKLQADDARGMLATADRLIACKGKKVGDFDVKGVSKKAIPEEAVTAMLGPTGNMRSPTLVVGKLLLVGYNDDIFNEVLG